MTVGEKIRAMRKEREITQKELGVKCGIAESTIRRYELGKLNPKYETRKKIAQGLGVPLVELLPEKDYGKTWLAYAYPPAHIDREAWTAKWVNSMPILGAGDLETRCVSCGNLVLFETPFCPYCGKAMTEEAWKELEKRVRGEK